MKYKKKIKYILHIQDILYYTISLDKILEDNEKLRKKFFLVNLHFKYFI